MAVQQSVIPARTPQRRSIVGPLWLQVMVGILLGVVVGILFPHYAIGLKPFGDAFIKLIRMTLAPIIFATVVVGIARMGDIREVGRVGAKALVYFEVVSSLALLLGLLAVNLMHPGRGMNIDAARLDPTSIASYASASQQLGVVPFLMNMIPSSIGEPFVTGNILQIILLGVLFGLALTPIRSTAKPLVDLLDLLLKGMFGIVKLVMYLAPLAALGAMAYTVGQYGAASLLSLARFTGEVWIVSILFVAIVLGTIARIAGFSLVRLLVYLRDELLITAGTSSSEAVLAPVMLKLEQLGCAEPVV
jgi:aerobic C4-dicarboxylate transport protein